MDEKSEIQKEASTEENQSTPEPVVTDTEVEVAAPEREKPTVTFMGNSYDLMSVVAVTLGGMILFTCFTCNFGYYCLPFIPVILGIIALISAKDSVDPERTKLLSWIGIGSGAFFIIIGLLAFIAYFAFLFFVIGMEGFSSGYGGY
jgi:hypothetical protein